MSTMLLCSPRRQQSTQERGTFCSLSPALKNSVYTNASTAGSSKPVTSSGFTHSPNLHVLLVPWIQNYEAPVDKCISMYTSSGGWFRRQLMIPEEFLFSHSSNRMWGEEILMWRITQHQRKKLFPLWFVGDFDLHMGLHSRHAGLARSRQTIYSQRLVPTKRVPVEIRPIWDGDEHGDDNPDAIDAQHTLARRSQIERPDSKQSRQR